ncbi:MAG: GNAT family N-acetyltransferase [Eubacteriales bacterium]|nr:GNAT family N-acetyltransferase [Eubacteriales bacterium]
MLYRHALVEDIPEILELQKKYHVLTISEEDKADGFVTTLFTPEQFKELIEVEDGITLAVDEARENKIVAYAMAASWEYWSAWPLFEYMIEDLANTTYCGEQMSTKNSYQYGPIAIDKEYRGKGVMKELFDYSLASMAERYPYMLTFVNQINPRSYEAHTRKAGCDVIKTFEFNNNQYWELGKATRAVEQAK